jgi:uracil-DNA glycosylase
MMPTVRVFVALGNLAWNSLFATLSALGEDLPKPRLKFGHGVKTTFTGSDGIKRYLLASYHPSQQNTFTGKLTHEQFDKIMMSALKHVK